jgi:hypothetical protein
MDHSGSDQKGPAIRSIWIQGQVQEPVTCHGGGLRRRAPFLAGVWCVWLSSLHHASSSSPPEISCFGTVSFFDTCRTLDWGENPGEKDSVCLIGLIGRLWR